MDIKNSKWLIAGGTGAVGEGIVRKLLTQEATVIVPVRSQAKETQLRDFLQTQSVAADRLITIGAGFGSPDEARDFSQRLAKDHPDIQAAVASLGGWWQGKPLHAMHWQEWQQVTQNNLNSHYLCMQAVYPQMVSRKEGMYVMINGGASEYPVPGSGAVSVMAAAQQMMAKVMAAENKHPSTLRVHSLVLATPVITRMNEGTGHHDWITAAQVGEYLTHMYLGRTGHRDEPVHHLRSRKDIKEL